MTRWYLRFVALIFAGFGLAYLLAPEQLASEAGLRASPAGWTDIRATYGGFQLGFAIFLLWSARSRTRFGSGLVASAILGGSVAGGRVLGLVIDGEGSWFHSMGLAMEVSLVLTSLWFYRAQLPRELDKRDAPDA